MNYKIMQCEYGENKDMFYAMRETGKTLNAAGVSVPEVEYIHSDAKWYPDARYFHSIWSIGTLIEISKDREREAVKEQV